MKKTITIIILTLVITVVVAAASVAVFVLTGAYNVSVSNHDNAFINWWLAKATKRSVEHRASGINAPDLENPATVQEGFRHYEEMCAQCHGAPGKPPGEIARGLWPVAPDLAKAVPDWNPAELFWITKNGLKFSAMPGWGATHSDDKLWAIVAFLEKLPRLAPADYHQMETNTVRPAHDEAHG